MYSYLSLWDELSSDKIAPSSICLSQGSMCLSRADLHFNRKQHYSVTEAEEKFQDSYFRCV